MGVVTESAVPADAPAERGRAVIVLGLFAATLAIVGPRHEPWFDEAQAWLIARDTTLWDLLAHKVRYEGSPGLWHALLWLLSRAGMPFAWLWAVSGALACAGAWIILSRAPFPFWLRSTIVFSYFMAYQYAVVARSYALDLLLIPLIAASFANRLDRPIRYGALLSLLANANAHSFIIAAPLFAEFMFAAWRRRAFGRAHVLGCAIYIAAAAAAVLQAWPPADAGFASGPERAPEVLRGLMMIAEAFVDRIDVWSPARPDGPSMLGGLIVSLVLLVPSAILFIRAGIAPLAAAVVAGLLGFSIIKHANAWHAGLLFLFWIFAIWIAWRALAAFTASHRRIITATVATIVSLNLAYTAAAALRDIREPYSAAPATAALLLQQGEDGMIAAAGFKTFALQPWFAANAFANYHAGASRPAHYTWQAGESFKAFVTPDRWQALIAHDGAFGALILSLDGISDAEEQAYVATARKAGYCERARLPGGLIWKSYVREIDAMLVFTRCTARARAASGR